MEVAAEKSRYTGEGVTVLTDSNGGEVTSPVKDITTANTTVKVPDGQTIVVGGMITNTDESIERKVPWLGDVPVVGQLFRYDSNAHYRTELLIFLTPRVIRCDQDSEEIKKVEAQRIHYFEDEAELIHGPLFGVPMEPGSVPPPEWEANILPQAISPPTGETPAPPTPEPDGVESAPQPIQQMKYEKQEAPANTKIKSKAKPFFKKSSRSTR
jgi:general secretion pathway protein D